MCIFEPIQDSNRLMRYNWQQKDWKQFTYDKQRIDQYVAAFSEKVGVSKGILNVLSKEQRGQSMIDALVLEALKTSEIEGEYISREDVLSSVKRNIGVGTTKEPIKDIRAKGISAMLVHVHNSYQQTLSEETIFGWHYMLFSGSTTITAGAWRRHSEPMQVVSGSISKEVVHFEAPASSDVPNEMSSFMEWFNSTAPGAKNEIKFAAVRSAIAHLYFESIHPFEDGNGRIGRAIAEKALLQSVGYPLLISLSSAIEDKRKGYYEALKQGQSSNEITNWIIYFIEVILNALDNSAKIIEFTIKKAHLFDAHEGQINERQEKVLKKMLESSLKEFEGGMSAKKYMKITKTSKATATRDIQKLRDLGIFIPIGEGRSTSYKVALS